ncbi:MAG TPA: rhomboid family intramembrane serine protease [Puia sp.]|nr:rhomboid family intramembrane serine protease [Puia sp.]
MNRPFQTKLRLIYFPFLLLNVGLTVSYTFLNWLLTMKFHLIVLKTETTNLWIPFVLPFLPFLIWQRKRVRLLLFKKTTRDPATAVVMLAAFATIVPMIIAQDFMTTNSGTLATLANASEINLRKDARYYKIQFYAIDRAHPLSHFTREVTGKYNNYLNFTMYMVCPLYDKGHIPASNVPKATTYPVPAAGKPLYIVDGLMSDDSSMRQIQPNSVANISVLKGKAAVALYGQAGSAGVIIVTTKEATEDTRGRTVSSVAWICKKYTKQISNNLSPEEKQEKRNAFVADCMNNYRSEPVTGYAYFDEIPYGNDYIGYKKAAENASWEGNNAPIHLLVPKMEPFENRNGSKLPWIFGSFAIGAALYFLVILLVPLDTAKVNAWMSGDANLQKPWNWKESFAWIIPRKGFIATPVIIYLNVLIFLAMVTAGLGFLDFNAGDLVSWGANYGPDIADGQWWRLLTSMFLHGGIMHLLLNMYGLLFVGLFLEPVLGKWRFALYYLATGLLAAIASLKIHPDSVGVGASGAIFGMYGVFLASLVSGVFPPGMKKAFLFSTIIFVGVNLVMGLSGNIDNAAHIGGLISGFLIGFFFARTQPDPVS